jgi:hypothetical protein
MNAPSTSPPERGSCIAANDAPEPKNKTDDGAVIDPSEKRNGFPIRFYYELEPLIPFNCFRCGGVSLDPCGRDGKRQWLCEACADGGEL